MDEKRIKSPDEIEINLWDIIGVLWKNAALIVLCGALFAMASLAITKFFMTPEYQSITKMYVLSKQSGDTLTQGDMQTSTYLTKDYAELIKSRTVTEAVIAELGLDMSSSALLGKVNVSTPADTRVVNISVTDEDPRKAAEIANAMRDASSEHIQKVMDIEAVNVVEDANVPSHPSGPNTTKNVAIGGVLGAFLIMLIVIIKHLMNDAIKTSDDVERYLGLSVLGVIPLREGEKRGKKKRIFPRNRVR